MKIEYRFDIAAMLLASVLTVLGIAPTAAGEKPNAGISGGSGATASAAQLGGKGGVAGGDVRSRGGKAGGVVGSWR
jgi:hypothetical protein